jgi:tRNA-Thr(GGU) m(6)t(6)A37 methyltransferase TsaA
MKIEFEPIGYIRTQKMADEIPRHWSLSDVEGNLEILNKYQVGLKDIAVGERVVVLFHFDHSPAFTSDLLIQSPPHRDSAMGVFSICSPRRPNAIGLSVVEVPEVHNNVIRVRGLDMFDGTPILDIKPFVTGVDDCPRSRHLTDDKC